MADDELIIQNELKVEGNSYDVTVVNLNLSRQVTDSGEVVSGIQGGIAEVSMPMEFESFDNHFFADWLNDPSSRKSVKVIFTPPPFQSSVLEITMDDAALVGFALFRDPVEEQTSQVTVRFASQMITVGSAPIVLQS